MPQIGIADKITLDAIKTKVDTNLDAKVSALNTNINTVKTNVGSNSDAASATGSVHAKLKQILAAMPSITQDPYGTPGPQILTAGTLGSGYFGFTSASELITGDALASAVGITQGTSQFSSEGWFKFAYTQKILFIAKKTIRHSISWDHINGVGAVFGGAVVVIGDKIYKVRLMTGGEAQPASKAGGEWNLFMYGLHKDQLPPWANYNDQDLHTNSAYGNGFYSWCQETDKSSSDSRVRRGGSGVASFYSGASASAVANNGWRPCLELVN